MFFSLSLGQGNLWSWLSLGQSEPKPLLCVLLEEYFCRKKTSKITIEGDNNQAFVFNTNTNGLKRFVEIFLIIIIILIIILLSIEAIERNHAISLQDPFSDSFSPFRYKGNVNCTVEYLYTKCKRLNIKCPTFNLKNKRRCNKGDYLQVNGKK